MSDFTAVVDIGAVFTSVELDEGVDFTASGDFTTIVIPATGFGEGGFGEGPFGGAEQIIIVNGTNTVWTNIDTP